MIRCPRNDGQRRAKSNGPSHCILTAANATDPPQRSQLVGSSAHQDATQGLCPRKEFGSSRFVVGASCSHRRRLEATATRTGTPENQAVTEPRSLGGQVLRIARRNSRTPNCGTGIVRSGPVWDDSSRADRTERPISQRPRIERVPIRDHYFPLSSVGRTGQSAVTFPDRGQVLRLVTPPFRQEAAPINNPMARNPSFPVQADCSQGSA
jgi:hypothetical protein